MVLSRSSHYALRAVLYIVQQSRDDYIPISEITRQLGLSFHFVTKILQRLSGAEILCSFKGPHGGIKLARPADKINLRHIVEAVEGSELFTGCLLGLNACSSQQPCPTHDEWTPLRDKMTQLFEKTTLAQLSSKSKSRGLRLINLDESR